MFAVRKEDKGKKYESSHLILRVNNLKKGRDDVKVTYPLNRSRLLAPEVNNVLYLHYSGLISFWW
jgi:hypothetical protein